MTRLRVMFLTAVVTLLPQQDVTGQEPAFEGQLDPPAVQGEDLRRILESCPEVFRWVFFTAVPRYFVVVDTESATYSAVKILKGAAVLNSDAYQRQNPYLLARGDQLFETKYDSFVLYRFDDATASIPDAPQDRSAVYRRLKASQAVFVFSDVSNPRSETARWHNEAYKDEIVEVLEEYGRLLDQRKQQQQKDEGRTENARLELR